MNLIEKLQAAPADLQELVENWPLCLDFGLPAGATAVVVGAYQGKVMELLCRLYPVAKVVGYEPQPWAYTSCLKRLTGWRTTWDGGYPLLFPFGLATTDLRDVDMGEYHTDAASLVNVDAREKGLGNFMDAAQALRRLFFYVKEVPSEDDRIDLMVMNIEGYEFALLPYLRKTGWLARIDRLAVQWHLFPDLEVEGRPLTEAVMSDEIALLAYDGFRLVHDRRPAWTYHER